MLRIRARVWLAVALAVLAAAPAVLYAQWGRFGGGRGAMILPNAPYDGRFAFVRIRYRSGGSWSADYPAMERNLSTMLKALTSMDPHVEATNVHTLDDPELHKFPVAYLTEPGYWIPNEEEVIGLRTYLAKGGFLIVDDFHFEPEWATFERAIRRVLPQARIDVLDVSHPVFHSFFEITSLRVPYPGRLGEAGLYGEFYGIHEDNDPAKRLSVVINYNMDIGDYMEWSATDVYNPMPTNEAYKFGINYVIYGLTH
ncbi:MAG: DUF4159 domain-containing protein [Acidobacteria bacterium]|nr:DUF4159 domain-containing protein [Acidobacteriota bacterium]